MTQNFSLEHIIREPKVNSEKSPLIILLHGYGSNENDLFSFADELPEEMFIVSAKAPYNMQPYGNAWYAIHFDNKDGKWSDDLQAIKSRNLIHDFIDEIIQKYPIDPDNITLLGFSQGSILSYSVALSFPSKIKNVVALSGYINEGIMKDGYEKNDFSRLSVYSSHGSADQVIPVEWARKNKPFLDNLDIETTYSEFPVGHGVAPQNLLELKNWLKDHI